MDFAFDLTDFFRPNNDTCSPVGLAARNGNLEDLQRLISEGQRVDLADNRGWYPLHETIGSKTPLNSNLDCMEELLQHEDTDVNWQTRTGETALLMCCRSSKDDEAALQAVQILLCRGADVNIPDYWNEETPLLAALCAGRKKVVDTLLDTQGVDTNLRDNWCWGPLHEAVWNGETDVVRRLVALGARIDGKELRRHETPVFMAATKGKPECLKVLLEVAKERDQLHLVNYTLDPIRQTALMLAARDGHTECVRLLLAFGADPNAQNVQGYTALHHSISQRHCGHESLQLLLPVTDVELLKNSRFVPFLPSRDPDSSDEEMELPEMEMINPLTMAVDSENHECLKLLLNAGFSADSIDRRYQFGSEEEILENIELPGVETPLSLALQINDLNAAKILLDAGASSNQRGNNVMPPLFSTILNGSAKGIDLLLEHNVDVSNIDLLLLAVVNPPNLLHILRRGAYPMEFLTYNLSVFRDAIFALITQEKIMQVLQILLEFVDHKPKASNLVAELADDNRDVMGEDHDAEGWNRLLEAVTSPPSLRSLCRVSLHRYLLRLHGTRLVNRIQSFQIPQTLTSYLNYEDVL